MKTYSELIKLSSFEERFAYLQLTGTVGYETFGADRYLNQMLYQSQTWRRLRNEIIIRDNGCDLGILGRPIYGHVVVHHINPISAEDVINRENDVLNPEFLICTSALTHKALHYSNFELLPSEPKERQMNDTCPWRN